jgi:3-(3-hydroxy-phenyl)propionate hydroxylase
MPDRKESKIHDLAIIGYGPVGALLANLLGQAGLSVLVIEKDPEIYPLPRAVHFDGEVMRVFESAGLRTAVEAISRPGLKGMHFVNAEGKTLLIRGGGAALGAHGCATNYYFHQPDLEHVLRTGVKRFSNVEVVLRSEVLAIRSNDMGVMLSTAAKDWQARYVVGCDGARSIVRKSMGSPMEDLGLDQPWLVFDAVLNSDSIALPEHTVQHCDPARPMTYCNITERRRRWEIMLMPGDDLNELVTPSKLWSLVQRWIKPGEAEIERATIYSFHSVIAQGWRKDRLMLAGDSAHQTPPFLGQGMCAGMRDASNLAWKLVAVLADQAEERLLDTYESERAPHVRAFIELAVKIGDIIQTTDPIKAQQRDQKFLAGTPEVFHFPAPKLGPGFPGVGSDIGPTGQIFPQPRLANGDLLDQRIGARFAVIATQELLDSVSAATKQAWRHWAAQSLGIESTELEQWFNSQGVKAVILRPDRYILGVAQSQPQLEALSQTLLNFSRTSYEAH